MAHYIVNFSVTDERGGISYKTVKLDADSSECARKKAEQNLKVMFGSKAKIDIQAVIEVAPDYP